MELGNRLRQIRKAKGIGIKTLAKDIKVDHSYISRIESGHVQPSEQVLHKIARILKSDEAELMLLANKIPRKWRTTIKKDPQGATLLIRESLGDYTTSKQLSLLTEKNNNGESNPNYDSRSKKSGRKSPSGVATNNLTFTAHTGTNDELFPQILSLYVVPGSTVADVTYGKGVFWRHIPKERYQLLTSDILDGTDCTKLPYKGTTIDCVVLDPPYMHTPGGTAHAGHQNYEGYYRNNSASNSSNKKYHEAVLDLYFRAGNEAHRVLKNQGIFIVKCADEVCANQQRLTHVEIINEYTKNGFIVEDLFVLVRNNRPGVSRMLKQLHARKNHSYFLVFRKSPAKTRWNGVKQLSSRN